MARYIGYTILLLAAACSGLAQTGWSIDVAPPRSRLIPQNELPIYCRSDREIEGCTEFLGQVLRCDCRRAGSGDGWSMAAHAQLVPYMYLTRAPIAGHERLHLDDLREQIGSYLADLTSRRFDDRESCASAADFEVAVFNMRMDLFSRLSNLRLH